MKRTILLTALTLALGTTGVANAQNPAKIVTPPTAAESTRVTGEAVDKSVKDALKTDEKEKKAKKAVEDKKKMKMKQ